MYVVEKHFVVNFGSSLTEYLYAFSAPLEGLLSRFAVKRLDGSGFTAFLMSNTYRQPDNLLLHNSNIISTHDEELLSILKLNSAGNFAIERRDFGIPFRNLHLFNRQYDPNKGEYPDMTMDYYLFLLLRVPTAANASFAVSLAIFIDK